MLLHLHFCSAGSTQQVVEAQLDVTQLAQVG
jgi:hypothetical protein